MSRNADRECTISLPMKAGLERAEQGTNLSGAADKNNTFLNESAQTAYKDMRKSRKGFNQSKYFCWSVQVVIWQIELAFFRASEAPWVSRENLVMRHRVSGYTERQLFDMHSSRM